MSRRRKKNPLLGRIFAISFAAHVVALPILAHFGVFEKVQKQFQAAQVVLVPSKSTNDEKDKPKQEKKKVEKPTTEKKGPVSTRKGPPRAPNPSAPKVVTAAGDGPGGSEGGAVESGSGKAGEVPKGPPEVKSSGSTQPEPKPEPRAEPKPEAPQPKPEPKPEPKAPPHVPVYSDPVATNSPSPAIPDDLRQDALDKTFIAEFVVGADGAPESVKVAQSTGLKELDQIALDAARQWRFRPATSDGKPVESRVRLRIEFSVE